MTIIRVLGNSPVVCTSKDQRVHHHVYLAASLKFVLPSHGAGIFEANRVPCLAVNKRKSIFSVGNVLIRLSRAGSVLLSRELSLCSHIPQKPESII